MPLFSRVRNLFSRMTARRHRRQSTSVVLAAEILEARELLSATSSGSDVMSIEVVATDHHGNPIDIVSVGQEFVVELVAKDLRPTEQALGVFSAYADVNFDPALVSFDSKIDFGDAAHSAGIVDPENERIDDVGSLKFYLGDEPQLERTVARFTATATEVGSLTLSTDAPDIAYRHNVLNEPRGTIPDDVRFRTRYENTAIQIVAAADIDGSGTFDFQHDGTALLAYSLGVRGNDLEAYRADGDVRTGHQMEAAIEATHDQLDLDGDGDFKFQTDGIILLAHSMGQRQQLDRYQSPDSDLGNQQILANVDEVMPKETRNSESGSPRKPIEKLIQAPIVVWTNYQSPIRPVPPGFVDRPMPSLYRDEFVAPAARAESVSERDHAPTAFPIHETHLSDEHTHQDLEHRELDSLFAQALSVQASRSWMPESAIAQLVS